MTNIIKKVLKEVNFKQGFLILLIVAYLLASQSFAAFPQEINYQGKLLDSGGSPLTGTYSIAFAIYDAASGGSKLWAETQSSVSVEAGVFNVLLGSVIPITTEAFDGSDRWLGIAVAGETLTPRHKLVSVGNTFHAYNADKLDGHDWSEVPSLDNVVLLGPASLQSTTAAYAVRVETSNSLGAAVFGLASDTSGSTSGGQFLTNGLSGRAVVGIANNASGGNVGGFFTANGSTGIGVYGYAEGTNARAIFGEADGGSNAHAGYFEGGLLARGSSYAITAETISLGGKAIVGNAKSTGSTENYGGFFLASGSNGHGVHGEASGLSGSAVFGRATNAGSGTNHGGFFVANGTNGIAVLGSAEANGAGTYGYGGYFTTRSRDGHAVYGESLDTNANSDGCGGYFVTAGGDGYAVYAKNTYPDSFGVSTGVMGMGYNYGVTGSSESGVGVRGYVSSSGGTGVWGYSETPGGTGVKGLAFGGFGKAIAGENTGGGYAGYFLGKVTVVSTSFEVTSLPTGTYNTVYYNTSTGFFFRSASSRRYKDQIKLFSTDFNKILKAEPKSFINKSTGDPNIGYIAEEFDEIGLKELVIYDKQGRPDALKYDRIPIYLLEVIKDQRKEIEELKSRLGAVESKLK